MTKHQLEIVSDALKPCTLPLYTSLVFEEVIIILKGRSHIRCALLRCAGKNTKLFYGRSAV